jgi:GT2 family glycosyltransferase
MATTAIANGGRDVLPRSMIAGEHAFSPSLVLEPVSRRPLRLPEATVRAVLAAPIPIARREIAGSDGREPRRASIVILTLNGLAWTKLCLDSLLVNTDHPDYEVIAVDNGSTDGTRDYLREVARLYPHVRPLFNDRNLGFAPAINQGLAATSGDVLVLLNNDTIVPPGWLTRLVHHLDDPAIGLVGPLTNRCGNEAQIEVPYRTYDELIRFADRLGRTAARKAVDLRTAIMFCAAMRRDVFARLGPLDERFEIGMFEDDDYAMRVRAAGLRVVCAEDAFVHHFGQGALGQLAATGAYGDLFHANRRRFEAKWDVTWTPHQGRPNAAYERLRERIQALVEQTVPPGATVLVVSKGDDELVRLEGRRGWHFPRTADGTYAGYYPPDSATAIAGLEESRANGADFFLIPATAYWWLDHYAGVKTHLDERYPAIETGSDDCRLFALRT